jgi:hypothetical protein
MIEIAFRGTRRFIHTLEVDVNGLAGRSKPADVYVDRVDGCRASEHPELEITPGADGVGAHVARRQLSLTAAI